MDNAGFRGELLSTENGHGENEFGANEWLVEEMYEQYKKDPNSVDASWVATLQRYEQHLATRAAASSSAAAQTPPVAAAAAVTAV
ncbi:MAG: hypothetical protein RL454_1205, partial [Actinomycetota bacterium]